MRSLENDIKTLLKEVEGYNWRQEHLDEFRHGVENVLNAGVQSYDDLYHLLGNLTHRESLQENTLDLIHHLNTKVDKRRVVPILLRELNNPNSGVRDDAVTLLGKLSSKRAVPTLLKIALDKSENQWTRTCSIFALEAIGDREACTALLSVLTDKTEDPSLRGEVADDLSYCWDERALAPLITCLADDSAEVRFWACKALYALGERMDIKAAVPELDRLAATDDNIVESYWSVRREAIGAIEGFYYSLLSGCIPSQEWWCFARVWLISPLPEYDDIRSWQQEGDKVVWSPSTPTTTLRIDPSWLAEKLGEHWLDVRFNVREPKLQSLLLDWQMGTDDTLLIGGLQSDGYAISLTCWDNEQVAEFTVWYRSIIASEHKLFLYSWAFNGRELTVEMKAEDVVNLL